MYKHKTVKNELKTWQKACEVLKRGGNIIIDIKRQGEMADIIHKYKARKQPKFPKDITK